MNTQAIGAAVIDPLIQKLQRKCFPLFREGSDQIQILQADDTNISLQVISQKETTMLSGSVWLAAILESKKIEHDRRKVNVFSINIEQLIKALI